jgi:hypothetical protein
MDAGGGCDIELPHTGLVGLADWQPGTGHLGDCPRR